MFLKNVVAGLAAVVIATVLGLIILGIIAIFPRLGILTIAALVGGLTLIIGKVMYEFGQRLCEFIFGWFY